VFPTQITLRNLAPSPALSLRVRELSEKLTHLHPRILNCRVAIEHPRPSGRAAATGYYVDVQLRLPEREVGVDPQGDTDLDAALRKAFLLLRRQLRAAVGAPTR
jgi:hypothetical protein